MTLLDTKGELEDSTRFSHQTLVYAIRTSEEEFLKADFSGTTITLYIPIHMVKELVETEKVGFETFQSDLKILIEKDFTCLDNVEEDQSDNYPNPLAIQKN